MLKDATGRKYVTDNMATAFSNNPGESDWINPGGSLDQVVVFDIPADTQPAEIDADPELTGIPGRYNRVALT